MTPLEHAIHATWPVVVAFGHRYVLDKLLAPVGRYVLKLLRPEKVLEKVEDKVEEVVEDKLVKTEPKNQKQPR